MATGGATRASAGRMGSSTAGDPALVKEGAVCTFETPFSVETVADLLASWSVRHPTTEGGASSSQASWGCWGSMAREGGCLLPGPKGRVSHTPHQQILFHSIPVKGMVLL